MEKERTQSALLQELESEDGVRVARFEGLSQVCTQLYRKLYSDPRVSVEVIEHRRQALDALESKVTLETHKILSKE